ncbi:unnamed protein product [Penicillium salamii]|nr:unnamed protein product [Penicillium salamii]CAG8256041.1 unnamed protein product [Penicillium salamii]
MKMIFSNDPDSDLFLGTQSSQNTPLPLHQARKDPALDTQDWKGYTPIHLAIESNRPEVVDLLLSHPCHSPISIAASRGCVSTVACLLSMGSVEVNGRGFIDPPICQAAAHGHHDVVRLLVQQGTCLNINKNTIASRDTALCIAACGGDLEMVQALLLHNQIDVNLWNEYFEDPLMLTIKDSHFSIVNTLLANTKLKSFSLKRSLKLARHDCIQRAIQNRMEADNTRPILLRRSLRMKLGGLYS